MFESSFTQTLFENLLVILSRNKYPDVRKINLGFGPFAPNVDFDKMNIAWENMTNETFLAECILHKKDIDGSYFCESCEKEYIVSKRDLSNYDSYQELFVCPECNSYKTKIISGFDIIIISIVVAKSDYPV